jgi:hypothetical protein
MDSAVWTEIGKISESEYDGDVSATIEAATIEALCMETFKTRGIQI